MKIGVTGSNGFIGKHLIDALKERKNVKLSYFDLPEYNLLNLDSVKNFVVGKDVIVHAAAVNKGSNLEIVAGSVVAAYNLISAIKKFGRKTKLIFLSSIQAETDTIYGLSKKLTEIMLQDFSREYQTPITIFRLTNVFGEGCRPFYNSVIATLSYQIANNKKLTLSDINKKINFIYVKDVVSIILREVFARRKQHFYFKKVTSNNTITVKNLSYLIKSLSELKNPKRLKSKFHKDLYSTYCEQKIKN